MSQIPTVSIILPTYNGASGYLDLSIQSCLNQTFSDWELIIVDDASTDHTFQLINQFASADPRIQCIRNPKNQKLPAALNTGFAQALGRYHTWTSDDNYFKPRALDQQVAFLDQHSDVDIVYTDYTLVDEVGEVIGVKRACSLDELMQNSCLIPCFLYRSSVFSKLGGYSDEYYLAEDYDFWLRASAHFRLQPLHKNLYYYRLHQDSLSKRYKRGQALSIERALKHNLPLMTWVSSQGRSIANLRLFELALRRHDLVAAIQYFILAIQNSPRVVASWVPNKILRKIWLTAVGLAKDFK